MKVTLQHNMPSHDKVFDDVYEVIFAPETVTLVFKPFLDTDPDEARPIADIVIKDQKTTGRRYWNYQGTWYPQFRILDPTEAVQLRLIE